MPTPASTRDMPLPVRIFHAAMEQQLSLADYAQRLGVGSESLRAVVTAQPNDDESTTLDRLAEVYHQPRETLPGQLRIAAPQESFAAWLKRNMDGISQHALRTRVQVDAKTLKRFLNAEMLPDSDQAERISRALYIDRVEIARVVVADMAQQAGADREVATTGDTAEQGMPPPAATAEPPAARPRRTRRQNPVVQADPAPAEGAMTAEADVAEPAPESEQPQHPSPRRQAGAKAPDATKEPASAPEAELPRRPASRRRTAPKTADSETMIMPLADPITQPDDQPVAVAVDEAPPAAAATDDETPPAAAATDDETPPALTAANQRTRKQRRAGSKQGVPDTPAPVTPPGAEATPAGEPAIELTSTPATVAPEPASVSSVLAADTTTLQLTADEVRLIRRWRQLHPQGRRATLHFIGSLLVED